jgi:4-diphosphocytidyl-2-C-methyl-D-erythritol kinase
MIVFPNAKINLGLAIVEKRSDGFHNIETVFYPIGLSDSLELILAKNQSGANLRFTSSGIKIPGNSEENLCSKTYHLLSKDFELPKLQVHLHKTIPIGAGLGGGSSDAAYFLKALNELAELNLAFGELHHYARQLGSDCSFFVNNQPAFAQGKGDEMEPCKVSLSGMYLVLIKPPVHISTMQAYSEVKPEKPTHSVEEIVLQPISSWKNKLHNQFENSVFKHCPQVKEIKENLYEEGAVYASMSGSGSSVFGLFEHPVKLKKTYSNCFIWQEKLA